MTLRTYGAFRITSNEALPVATGIIPADILAKGLSALYYARRNEGHTERKNAEKSNSNDV